MKLEKLFLAKKAIITSRKYLSSSSGIPCIHYGDIYKYYSYKAILSSEIINGFMLNVSSDKYISQDSIVIPDVTETINDFGNSVYIKYNGTRYINGTHTIAITSQNSTYLKYLFYYLQNNKNKKKLQSLLLGSTVFQLSLKDILKFELVDYDINVNHQQHIIDIIGSIDDKIEKNNKIIKKLEEFGIKNYFKLSNKLEDILLYSKFERGKEASSKNYSEIKQKNFINFIRVKDLNILTNTYISNSLKLPLVEKKDTIIALDGTVGRINFGLSGAYSSGLYKVVPVNEKYRGIIYFSLKDNFNQNIIQYYATGTTILHAGKSINHLKIKKHKENDLILFNKLYEFMLLLKQENIKLNNLKQLYLKKFFG